MGNVLKNDIKIPHLQRRWGSVGKSNYVAKKKMS